MKTLEQLNAEHAAAVARLTVQHAIAGACPVPPDSVMVMGRAPWVGYTRKTLAECLDVFRAFTIVPVEVWKGTFTSVLPESEVPERDKERVQSVSGPHACWIDVHEGEKFGPTAELSFYAQLPERVVNVHVKFGADYIGACHALRADVQTVRNSRTQRVESRTYKANPVLYSLCDKHIKWASGDSSPVQTSGQFSYLFSADHFEPCAGFECTHAVGQLVNLSSIAKV